MKTLPPVSNESRLRRSFPLDYDSELPRKLTSVTAVRAIVDFGLVFVGS
jgi:hypothetical protein